MTRIEFRYLLIGAASACFGLWLSPPTLSLSHLAAIFAFAAIVMALLEDYQR